MATNVRQFDTAALLEMLEAALGPPQDRTWRCGEGSVVVGERDGVRVVAYSPRTGAVDGRWFSEVWTESQAAMVVEWCQRARQG